MFNVYHRVDTKSNVLKHARLSLLIDSPLSPFNSLSQTLSPNSRSLSFYRRSIETTRQLEARRKEQKNNEATAVPGMKTLGKSRLHRFVSKIDPTHSQRGWQIMVAVVIGTMVCVVVAFECIVVGTFLSQRQACTDVLGDAARCAWPQHYYSNGLRVGVGNASVCALDTLTKITCANAGIVKLPESDRMVELVQLTSIDFRGNTKLSRLPNSYGQLRNLSMLNMSMTALRTLPYALCNASGGMGTMTAGSITVSNSPASITLDWSSNNPPIVSLGVVSEGCLAAVAPTLEHLNLSNNRMGARSPSSAAEEAHLVSESARDYAYYKNESEKEVTCNLAENLPPKLGQTGMFPRLRLIDLSNNSIDRLRVKYSELGNMLTPVLKRGGNRSVLLDGNVVQSYEILGIGKADNSEAWIAWFIEARAASTRAETGAVKLIHLKTGYIARFPTAMLSGLSGLRELSFQLLGLHHISPGSFADLQSLERLDLESNSLTALDVDTFVGLTSLQFLSIGQNKVATLDVGLFSSLKNLTELKCNDNGITSLSPGVFAGLGKVKKMTLRGGNKLTASNMLMSDVWRGLEGLRLISLAGNDGWDNVSEAEKKKICQQVRSVSPKCCQDKRTFPYPGNEQGSIVKPTCCQGKTSCSR